MINIVLFEPEIPNNTGNIVRTCAATGAVLHVIEPCGFSWEDKYLKRSGLDYWEISDVRRYENIYDFLKKNFGYEGEENMDKAVNEIEHQLDLIKNGDFDDEFEELYTAVALSMNYPASSVSSLYMCAIGVIE